MFRVRSLESKPRSLYMTLLKAGDGCTHHGHVSDAVVHSGESYPVHINFARGAHKLAARRAANKMYPVNHDRGYEERMAVADGTIRRRRDNDTQPRKSDTASLDLLAS